MTYTVTTRQSEILSVIKTFIDETGQSPSLSELERSLGITRRGVVKHLQALERKGLLNRTSQSRSITLSGNREGQMFMDINILGYANAGTPMVVAEEQQLGYLRIKRSLLPVSRDVFALQIKGDSMNNREIRGRKLADGKYAVIVKNQDVHNGDAVLAIIDNCATIKTYKQDRDIIVLYPESTNNHHKPFYLDARTDGEELIYGKVIAVLDNPNSSNDAN